MMKVNKKIQPIGKEGAIPHIVYDLSLPLEQRKAKAMRFDSLTATARFLGVNDNRIINHRKVGKQLKVGEKIYAVRLASEK